MKTYLFVRNKKYRPSTYYRIYQYIEDIDIANLKLCEYESDYFYEKNPKNKVLQTLNKLYFGFILGYIKRIVFIWNLYRENDYNVFVQREIFPRFIGPLGKFLLKRLLVRANKVFWDFDDNIFDGREITVFETQLLCKHTTEIFAGNEYLKQRLNDKYFNKVKIINTTDKMMENVDIDKINIKRINEYDNEVVLVWVGTKGNLKFLENIILDLDEAAMHLTNKEIVLRVVSNAKIDIKTEKLIIENIIWERKSAFKEMLNAHIGLMPLEDDELTKGKCAFKAVQSIGCGLPIIVSNVGMNNEVVNGNGYLVNEKKEWVNFIIKLSSDKEEWIEKSISSRRLWERKFNSVKISKMILEPLSSMK
ncbi:glycosyltransferase [Peribacillus simplex]|uniref:glycosyltransferase n=1 Tax=Peribacillus simplex TaxID=1478 RepID=UPI000BA4F4E9|nr:glycosyltransferase [Peribacillus simplex]PAL14208.1 hypothetical protein B8W99_07345 [Peribacillus simplex]